MSAVRGSSTGGTSRSWPPDLELEDQRVAGIELDDEVLGPPSRPRYPDTLQAGGRTPRSKAARRARGRAPPARSMVEPTTSSRRSSFMVSTSGSSGMCIYTLSEAPRSTGGLRRLARERRVALSQGIIAVGAHRSYLEACPPELGGKLRRLVQPHAVDLVCPPVVSPTFLKLTIRRSIVPFSASSSLSASTAQSSPTRKICAVAPGGPARDRDVEDEDAAGSQRLEDAPEEGPVRRHPRRKGS